MAITVADDFQGRGLGSILGEHLAHSARNRGIRRFTATMSANNVPAHRLMARLTDHLEQRHVGSPAWTSWCSISRRKPRPANSSIKGSTVLL